MSIFGRPRRFWQRFKRAQRGTTAIIFGIMVIPLIAITGGVVDYGRAVKTKAQLSTALDAALLAAMLQYSLDDDTDYKKVIEDFIKKNLSKTDKTYQGLELNISVPDITEEGEMKAGVSTKVATNFLRLVGFDEFNIRVNSASMVGGNSIEVALVLDNTFSMSADDKINDLKDAAKELVETLIPGDDVDNVRISLIPFADMVNIGVDNRFEPGLDIPNQYSVPKTGWCDNNETINVNCDQTEHDYDCDKDGVPSTCSWTEYTNCETVDNPNYGQCEPDGENTYDWYGCMGSRKHDLNVKDEDYGTGVPGIMSTWNKCSKISAVTRLTSSKSQINADIDKNESGADGHLYSFRPGLGMADDF